MWTYEQHSGELFNADGELSGTGYSGFGQGKNVPSFEDEPNVGPIPKGRYTIREAVDLAGGPHGPFVLPLTPDATNEMYERSAFLIHGDSISHPGAASRGCIILSRKVREQIASSVDNRLMVEA